MSSKLVFRRIRPLLPITKLISSQTSFHAKMSYVKGTSDHTNMFYVNKITASISKDHVVQKMKLANLDVHDATSTATATAATDNAFSQTAFIVNS